MIDYFLNNPYPFIFTGLFFGGESVLFPSIFLALEGIITFRGLIITAALATILSDTAWYIVGRFSSHVIFKWAWLKSTGEKAKALSAVFDRHGLRILFYSKFVYGTRTAVQILSGMHRMPFWKYISINTLGVLALLEVVIIVGIVAGKGTASFTSLYQRFSIFFLVGMGVVILLHLWLKKLLKKWFP